jgi:Flp pilus assembly protein TadD
LGSHSSRSVAATGVVACRSTIRRRGLQPEFPPTTRAFADTARRAFEAAIRGAPDDAQQHVLLGVSLAFLGRRDKAIRAAERAVELLPMDKDAYIGPYIQLQLARVHMMVGNKDKAVELLCEGNRQPQ